MPTSWPGRTCGFTWAGLPVASTCTWTPCERHLTRSSRSDETGWAFVPPHVDQSKQLVREGTLRVANDIVFQPLLPDGTDFTSCILPARCDRLCRQYSAQNAFPHTQISSRVWLKAQERSACVSVSCLKNMFRHFSYLIFLIASFTRRYTLGSTPWSSERPSCRTKPTISLKSAIRRLRMFSSKEEQSFCLQHSWGCCNCTCEFGGWWHKNYGNVGFTTVQEREASANPSRIYHSDRETSVSSSSLFRASTGKLVAMFSHKRKSRKGVFAEPKEVLKLLVTWPNRAVQVELEALAKLSDMEHHARILLKEQRQQMPSEAKFELLLQETRADHAVNSIENLNRQFRSQDTEICRRGQEYGVARREYALLRSELQSRERVHQEARNRSSKEVEELKAGRRCQLGAGRW